MGSANQPVSGSANSLEGRRFAPRWLLAAVLIPSTLSQPVRRQEKVGPAAAAPAVSPASPAPLSANAVTSGREGLMLRRLWGIEDVHVRYTASGSMIRFSYRVVDAAKAKVLNDKKLDPFMLVHKTGARLGVPETEKVGKLRQTADPRMAGSTGWSSPTSVAW